MAQELARAALVRRGVRSRWYPTRRGHIHYYDAPGGGDLPPSVLLHGLGTSATAFAPLLGLLRPHFRRLLVPDHLGHGFSAHHHQAITPDDLLAATTEVLRGSLDSPAILVGNSMGGALALRFAAEYPDRVLGLLLVSPAGAPFTPTEWAELVSAFSIESRRDAWSLFHRIYHRPPRALSLFAHELGAHFSEPAVRALLASATNSGVTTQQLRELKMPVRLLWGASERLLPASQLAYFERHLPAHAEIERPPDFGHSPHVDAPRALAEEVLRFARTISESRGPKPR